MGERVYTKEQKAARKVKAHERWKRWYVSHPRTPLTKERRKDQNRASHLRLHYGLSLETFRAIIRDQGGKCAICGKDAPNCLDHNHVTGKIRGVLCYQCNAALGMAREDSSVLSNMIAYLDKYRE